MQILYIGYYTSDDLLYEIQNRGINNMSVARQMFETNLINGMIEESDSADIHFVSYVPVDDEFIAPAYSEISGVKVYHIPINRRSVLSIAKAERLFSDYLRAFGEKNLLNLHVLMYEVNPLFMLPLLRMKRKFNMKLITLCAELSSLRRSKRIQYQIRNKLFAHFERKFDGYILFAKPMERVLRCQNKPQVVVEGIAPDLFGEPSARKKNIVMYAGGLGIDNNLTLLIDACMQLDEVEELWICGTGKDKAVVEEASKVSSKIKYFGMIPNNEVRELEKKAKVLVNLRMPDAPITKYSFPSKLLEYIASGTLVLSTRLEGIPQEYYEYIIPVNSLELRDVMNDLSKVLRMKDDEYIALAERAQQFITYNKNKNVQAARVLEFVNNI